MKALSEILIDVQRAAKAIAKEPEAEKRARICAENRLNFELHGYERAHESFEKKTLPLQRFIGDEEL
jgi:hypothetical protein